MQGRRNNLVQDHRSMKNATLVFIGLILASVLVTGLLWAESGGKLDLAPLCWLEAILLPISGIGYWIHLTEMKIALEMQGEEA